MTGRSIQQEAGDDEFPMPEFTLPFTPREQAWIDLRNRLARAAHELLISAVSGETEKGSTLLVIAGNLAGLALSINVPATQKVGGGLVHASTLLAAQILQPDTQLGDDDSAPARMCEGGADQTVDPEQQYWFVNSRMAPK